MKTNNYSIKIFNKNYALLAIFSAFALSLAQVLIYFYAPIELSLGIVQKIFYTHVPLAWWGLFSFFILFVASIAYLITKKSYWTYLAFATAEIGVLFSVLAIATGSFWAKSSWNVWWIWDPRLTTTLIMCFIYSGYLMYANMDISFQRKQKICAVIGIVAFLDVPLVYFSARLWSFVHPSNVVLEPEMLNTLIYSIFALGVFWFCLVALRFSIGLFERTLYTYTQNVFANLENN